MGSTHHSLHTPPYFSETPSCTFCKQTPSLWFSPVGGLELQRDIQRNRTTACSRVREWIVVHSVCVCWAEKNSKQLLYLNNVLADFAATCYFFATMSASPAGVPSNEEQAELLLSCRYGDLEDVQEFVKKFGPESLTKIRDDNGNTVLHMICGNGHSGESPIVQSLNIESHSSKIFGRYPWFPGADRTSDATVCPK